MIEVTPMMIKAAWVEARRWWPREIAEAKKCTACGCKKGGFRVIETCILVDQPTPGFAEAIRAAFAASKEAA